MVAEGAVSRPRPLRIGLVGCGRWGRFVLRDLVTLGCHVPVVARSAESRRNAQAGGADLVVDSIEALPVVDGVVVAAPTRPRTAVITALLARQIPIFTEKPLAATVEEAEQLARAGVGRLFVMEKWRYHPGVMEMARINRSAEFGAVRGVRTARLSWGIDHPDVDAVWTLLPHDIAIVDEILDGIPQPQWAVGEILGGEPAALLGGLGQAPWAVVEVSAVSDVRKREVRLCCEQATVVLAEDDHLAIISAHQTGAPPTKERRNLATELPLMAELREFVGHVDGGPAPRVPASRGVEVVRAAAKLRELAGFDGA